MIKPYLPPFKRWTLQNFPFIEDDFDAITNYQLYCKIVEYMKSVDTYLQGVDSFLTEVETYFNNLDVQEEINNKLDEMAEDGTLEEIITQYLQINGVLAFNTLNDLKQATNLIDGSICRTLGTTTYNDGYGYFYKIRTITSGDVVDNDKIVALSISNTLIAEKINNRRLDILTNDITLFIGDSYGANNQSGWVKYFIESAGLTLNTNCYNYCYGGTGFTTEEVNFLSQLISAKNTLTSLNKIEYVKNIIVCGGWNDRGQNDQIENAVASFISYCKNNFPNAKVYIGMIANYGGIDDTAGALHWREYLQSEICNSYKKCIKYGGIYLNNVESIMHQDYTLFSSDYIHPSDDGYKNLGYGIYEAFKSGIYLYSDVNKYLSVNSTNFTLNENVTSNFGLTILPKNGKANITFSGTLTFTTPVSSSNLSISNYVIGSFTDSQKYFRYVNALSSLDVDVRCQLSDNSYIMGKARFSFNRSGNLVVSIVFPQNVTVKNISTSYSICNIDYNFM